MQDRKCVGHNTTLITAYSEPKKATPKAHDFRSIKGIQVYMKVLNKKAKNVLNSVKNVLKLKQQSRKDTFFDEN